ncbi:WD40-repeat-containing domain protein [Choanephora cucurbitarum]|nr:WD40-repeat-containing domain protein [Choanephora cucurbitarum]
MTVIEGHTEINVPVRSKDDLEDPKDIWCCEFEPKLTESTNDIVALAGSYSVLFMDVQQGRYIKKYTHTEDQEIFYTLAWSTLKLENESSDTNCNVLAVAGRLGSIKLINPLQHECYRYLFGHRQPVLKLVFSKSEPRWLFSVSADNTVRLWDVGSPTSRTDDSMCLAKFTLPTDVGVPSTLSVSYDLSTVIVGCDNGDMVRYDLSDKILVKLRQKMEQAKKQDAAEKWFNPMTIESTMTYPSGDEWHAGYVDDICILGQDGNAKDPLYNKVLSRGANDLEILLWNLDESTPKDAEIEKSFDWPDSAECTGLRFKVVEREDTKALIAGEYEGQIHIYNISDGKKSKMLDDGSMELFHPTTVLSHPKSSQLIRDVCCSTDTRTIVAVDNNNTAFVWTTVD